MKEFIDILETLVALGLLGYLIWVCFRPSRADKLRADFYAAGIEWFRRH